MTTKILDFIDYETLRQYARTCCRQKRVRDGDAEDVAHDAWLACQRRGRAAVAKGNPEALARKIMFTSIQNAIKARKARTVPEAPLEDALAKRPAAFSDRGAEAERAFLAADDWENPFWLRLFEAERKAIERDARGKRASKIPIRLVRLLLKDSRLALARAELKVSYPVFRTNIENLKVRFALCFRAYQAHRRHQATFNS